MGDSDTGYDTNGTLNDRTQWVTESVTQSTEDMILMGTLNDRRQWVTVTQDITLMGTPNDRTQWVTVTQRTQTTLRKIDSE